jgi:prepilin-type N-terminal cleavage/methylation domain-containing protein
MSSRTTTPPRVDPPAPRAARRGFTLVELMVVVVVILVLASLMLSGLAVARQRARIARTKSTIRKLNEIVVPHYESYLRRRVPFAIDPTNARTNATNRLRAIRELMVFEMPDSGSDIGGSIPAHCETGPVRSYATSAPNTSAECLHMIVSRGGIDPDLMEQFRSDEIGDVDNDGLPEFLDGWSKAIIFLRWAPGFTSLSPVQVANATTHHDPFDPQRVDPNGYALVPLVVSGGPDGLTGLQVTTAGWRGLDLTKVVDVAGSIGAPDPNKPNDHRDNITNHDLSAR